MCDKGVKEGWAGDGGVGRSACAISDGRMWDGGKQTLAGVNEVGAGAQIYSAQLAGPPHLVKLGKQQKGTNVDKFCQNSLMKFG